MGAGCAGSCDDLVFCNGVELCDPGSVLADPRGCVSGTAPCEAGRCDEAGDQCIEECTDGDGDGVAAIECGGLDCNDANAAVFQGAPELCDAEGVDEDCDPSTFGGRDIDGDGAFSSVCCNAARCGTDCDDARPGVSPTAPEACDGLDNDCDGDVDEGLLELRFRDIDRDLHGDPDAMIMACPGAAGTSASDLDCNDFEPTVNRTQVEITDGLDNDCDGTIDENPQAVTWYADDDGDLFGNPDGATVEASTVQAGFSMLPFDCNDMDAMIGPLAAERCNGIDDDCNGLSDFVLGVNDWEDDDGDGYPDANCAPGPRRDCDDRDPQAFRGAVERCDGRDNDCDASVDEGCARCNPGDTSVANLFTIQVSALASATGDELVGVDLDGRVTVSDMDALGCFVIDWRDPLDGEPGVDGQSAELAGVYADALETGDIDALVAAGTPRLELSVAGLSADPGTDSCVQLALGAAAPVLVDLQGGRFQAWTRQTIPVWIGGLVNLEDVVLEGTFGPGPTLTSVVITGRVSVDQLVAAFIAAVPGVDPGLIENLFEGAADLPPVEMNGTCTGISHVLTATAAVSP